ncbi:MAG TPA: SCO family protein [Candidatus Binataceae bacterium]|nr:SCO family protein [Candidatus Binataceae bacterium]
MSCAKNSAAVRSHAGLAGALAALTLAWSAAFGLSGCARRPAEIIEPGSYPAANPNDCLPDITLIDQHGHDVTLSSLKGRPVLIDFIYTTCPGPCPLMTARMAAVANLLGAQLGSKVTFLSITLDPEHDHPPRLLKYAQAAGADRPGWLFLTGAPMQIEQLMAIYRLRRERNADGSIEHATVSFLLGPDGHQLRQYAPLHVKAAAVVADIERALARS